MRSPLKAIVGVIACAVVGVSDGSADEVYFNDFNGPFGSKYPEWSSSPINFLNSTNPPGSGVLPPKVVTNCDATNHTQRFLGEFGGPRIGMPGDPGYNWTRVEETISLTLTNLPPHAALTVSFELYVLKSWDGNSPRYGPDRWRLGLADGPTLLDTTFSNNHKVSTEGSDQDFPRRNSAPRSSAGVTNTLGYTFFGDSIYPFKFAFPHTNHQLRLEFSSSLFEGKGIADESWGLDNVRIRTDPIHREQ